MEAAAHYELTELLGSGGMGHVYGAIHHPSGASVAVKILREDVRTDPWRRRLLLNEATAVARLRHPNIVQLLDLPGAAADGTTCLVLERVDGVDLSRWLERWPGWTAIASVLADVLAGLSAAHAAGIVHGDLKPGNILVATGSGLEAPPTRPDAKITDFGIARVRDPISGEESISGTAGTPQYMAPEQFMDDQRMGPWSDLYAVGAMLFEIITGDPPYPPASPVRMVAAKLTGAPGVTPRPGLQIPMTLTRIIRELLAPDPRQRPRFAVTLSAELARAAEAVVDEIDFGTVMIARPRVVADADSKALTGMMGPDVVVGMEGTGDGVRSEAGVAPTMASSGSNEVQVTELHPDDGARTLVDDSARIAALRDARETPLPDGGTLVQRPRSRSQNLDSRPGTDTSPGSPMPGITFLEGRAIAAPRHVAHGGALLRLREPPFIGRAGERQSLEALAANVIDDRLPRVLALLGEAGVGKSRVARWGLAETERRGHMEGVAAGYGPTGGEATGGLRRALRSLIGMPRGLGDDLRALEETWSWLADAQGKLPFDTRGLSRWLSDDGATLFDPAQAAGLAQDVLRAACRTRPIYLWLDDLAWSDDGGLEMVEALMDAGDLPMLVVATLRTGTTQAPRVRQRLDALFAAQRTTVHTLKPFDLDDRVLLLQSIVPLTPDAARRIAETLDGTPLLMVQMVYDWLETGQLVEGPVGWDLPDGRLPVAGERPLEALMGQRFEALLETFGDEKAAAERLLLLAALLGNRFEDHTFRLAAAAASGLEVAIDDTASLSLEGTRPEEEEAKLLAAAKLPAPLVDSLLDRALFHGLLRSVGENNYQLDHGTVREALLRRVQEHPHCADLQVATARALLAAYGRTRGDTVLRAAELLHEARDLPQAWWTFMRAVHSTAWTGALATANQYLDLGREWLAEDRTSRAYELYGALLHLAEARIAYFDLRYDDALTALAAARDALLAFGVNPEDPTLQAMPSHRRTPYAIGAYALVITLWGDVLFYLDRFGEAEQVLNSARPAAAAAGHLGQTAFSHIHNVLALIASLRGDYDAARELYQKRKAASRDGSGERNAVMSVLSVGCIAYAEDDLDQAELKLQRCEELLEPGRTEGYIGEILDLKARVQMARGDAATARATLRPRVREVEGVTDRWRLTALRSIQAEISVALDPVEQARHATRRFIDAFRDVHHDEVQVVRTARRLAEALRARDEAELAETVDQIIETRQAVIRERLQTP